jgi:RHS repeat-associated protein
LCFAQTLYTDCKFINLDEKGYLGSITQITDNSGNLAAEYSYDTWGRMRNPVNWNVYAQGSQPAMLHGERGYTGHEQLNQFGLINMNARLYDPLLARFLAPDPQVGDPETSNGYNRYMYASDNPMMFVDINGEEGLPWWWFGGNNNPSGGYQPDYNSNPGSNSGNNFHNNYSGPGSGNQGGGYSGYDGGNYGGNDSGNTTGLGSILFSILHEAIYGSGSSDTNKSNPFAGLNFKPTEILSVTPARKPFTPLSKPVGTGVSNVYSGGGKNQGNSSSNWLNGAQYGMPVLGSCLQASDALNNGEYLNWACFFGLGFFEAFTLGEGTEVRLEMNATKEGATLLKELPTQLHHFATTKSARYTSQMAEITDQFGLDLEGTWNKELLPHLGRHPNVYHDFVLEGMQNAAAGAGGSQAKFLELFNIYVKQPVIENPLLLRKAGW